MGVWASELAWELLRAVSGFRIELALPLPHYMT
jgi:hypothetical protein